MKAFAVKNDRFVAVKISRFEVNSLSIKSDQHIFSSVPIQMYISNQTEKRFDSFLLSSTSLASHKIKT